MNTGEVIRARREALGITQAAAAAELGVTQAMLCQLERGSKVPSLPLAKQLCQLLHCTLDELCGKEVTS